MAERVGFEPTNELPHCWFSRPVLSTAQPPLQILIYRFFYIFIVKKTTFICFTFSVNSILSITMINNLN